MARRAARLAVGDGFNAIGAGRSRGDRNVEAEPASAPANARGGGASSAFTRRAGGAFKRPRRAKFGRNEASRQGGR